MAEPRTSVLGYWSSGDSIFHVHETAGNLHATIVSLNEPVYSEEEDPARAGMSRQDDENPDESLRSRQVIGINMLDDYQFIDNRWRGRIYDPESGNTYQSRMRVNEAGRLEIRGYIGMPMFGRTAEFESISTCSTQLVAMLATEQSVLCDAGEADDE